MKFKLLPFQEIGVDFLLSHQKCLLADAPGNGKTYQALEAVSRIEREIINVLIVCPSSLVIMWSKACAFWVKGCQVVQLRNYKNKVHLSGKYRFCIVSYNFIQKEVNVERLLQVRWAAVISDECHCIKNFRSKTCKGFLKIIEKTTGYVWLMSGSPATKNAQDYYPYLQIIQPGKWGAFWQFSETFCHKNYFNGFEGIREDKKPILKKAFEKIMLRRLRKDVEKELPKRIITFLPVPVDASIVEDFSDISKEVVFEKLKRGENLDPHMMRAIRLIGLGKIPAAVDYVSGLNEPVIIFCKHIDVALELETKMKGLGLNTGKITGSESREEKDKAVEDFQAGKLDCLVCNIAAGGTGITLHRASHMLFVESDFSPAIMEQAICRIDRIGQMAKQLVVTHLVAHNTVDEVVQDILNYKATFLAEVMGDRK